MSAISQQLLTRFWWNFKGRFLGISLTMSQWHLSRHHMSWRYLSISTTSQLLLTQLGQNFKGGFLGTSRTDFNCHGDICLCNICPGDILSYQEYLRFWPNFLHQFFWGGPNLCGSTFLTKHLLTQIIVGPNMFWTKISFKQNFSAFTNSFI